MRILKAFFAVIWLIIKCKGNIAKAEAIMAARGKTLDKEIARLRVEQVNLRYRIAEAKKKLNE